MERPYYEFLEFVRKCKPYVEEKLSVWN
jgi:hypothetical protein